MAIDTGKFSRRWSLDAFKYMCLMNDDRFGQLLIEIGEFEFGMLQLSSISGLSVSACGDIVRNVCKATDYPWEKVVAGLKYEIMKGNKIHE